MTKNITAALFAVFIFAAIPTPASTNPASTDGGGGSGVGEGGQVHDYWKYLEDVLTRHRARMRWYESKYPEEINKLYLMDSSEYYYPPWLNRLTKVQKAYLKHWDNTKRIRAEFLQTPRSNRSVSPFSSRPPYPTRGR